MLLGRFGESKAVQLRVDLNRRHVDIIPSPVRERVRDIRRGQMTGVMSRGATFQRCLTLRADAVRVRRDAKACGVAAKEY
jgi:hypothetical protein